MLDINEFISFLSLNLENLNIQFININSSNLLKFDSNLFDLEFESKGSIFIIENFNILEPNNGLGQKIIKLIINYLTSNGFEKIILRNVNYEVYEYFWQKFGFIRNEYLGDNKYYLDL